MNCKRAPSQAWEAGLTPIKISQFAIDDQTPHRDLYLSPAHALYLNGLLIPVKNFVNGITITDNHYAEVVSFDYYHVELEQHDVIIAEGAPAETFTGIRRWAFDNADAYEKLYGADPGIEKLFAPLVSLNGGRDELASRFRSIVSPIYDVRRPLDVIRDQIAARAELKLAA